MAIPPHLRTNFQTMLRAAEGGDLALMEAHDAVTGQVRYVICMVGRDGQDTTFSPVANMYHAPNDADFDPFGAYIPAGEGSEAKAREVREAMQKDIDTTLDLATQNVIDDPDMRDEAERQESAIDNLRRFFTSLGFTTEGIS